MNGAQMLAGQAVIFLIAIGGIVLFWIVHVLPEKIAHKRLHPQRDAFQTLCLLSLVFGGLLWPIAWILAYTKPVIYKMAYGRDKHDDYYAHLAATDAKDAALLGTEVTRLRAELDTLAARGKLPAELQDLRERLGAVESRVVAPPASEGGA